MRQPEHRDSERISLAVSGTVDGIVDRFSKRLPGRIASIREIDSSVEGRARFSGEGTTTLTVEVWASGTAGRRYQGTVACIVVYE